MSQSRQTSPSRKVLIRGFRTRERLMKRALRMVVGCRRGQTAQSTRGIGRMGKQMGVVDSYMPRVMFRRWTGSTARRMARATTCMLMDRSMKVAGKMTCSTEMAMRRSLMDLPTKDNTSKERNMARVSSSGKMGTATLVSW